MDVVINKAKANAEAEIQSNNAQMSSLKENVISQAQSYSSLKKNLAMTND